MSVSFNDLQKYAEAGIASDDMTHYDKMNALAMFRRHIRTKMYVYAGTDEKCYLGTDGKVYASKKGA
jgi:hypothetical protein